jgi:hypothetical protein
MTSNRKRGEGSSLNVAPAKGGGEGGQEEEKKE